MVTAIVDELKQVKSDLGDITANVEDLPAGESRDTVLGILDVIQDDLDAAVKELGKLDERS